MHAKLGWRFGVSQSQATHLEKGEIDESITLRSLRAAVEELECELVHAQVPRQPLDELLQGHAKRVVDQRLARTGHTVALENRALTMADQAIERDRLVAELLKDPRRIRRADDNAAVLPFCGPMLTCGPARETANFLSGTCDLSSLVCRGPNGGDDVV